MTYRNAIPSDLNYLVPLFDAYRMFYHKPSDIASGQVFLKERMSNKESIIYMAEDHDKLLAGFVQLYPLFSSVRMNKIWLLNDLFVDKNYRGRGISSGLIRKAKELVYDTNAAGLTLETGKNNEIGNILYPKMGFELIDDTNFYAWQAE